MSSHFRVFSSLLRCLKRTSAALVFFWPAVALPDYHLLFSRQKKRNAVRQLVMNNFEFFALFHLSCVSKPGYRICKLFRFDVCMSFITL